jgi:hypothetical protein
MAYPGGTVATPQGMAMGSGMNQMLELFKMQYVMKFMDGSGGRGGATSLLTMFVLMGYDHAVKFLPLLFTMIYTWIQVKVYGKLPSNGNDPALKDLPLMPTTPPPTSKSIRACIQFERHPDRVADARIDAVMFHVCNLPDVRSLRYNGMEMIPNFRDSLMIDTDIWFEINNPNQQTMFSFTSSQGVSKDSKSEPIVYRLSTYDHDITWLHKFVEQAMDTYEQEKRNKLGSESYYFDQMTSGGEFRNPMPRNFCMFTKSKFLSNRSLDNVYLRQIGELKQRVEFFLRRRDWYDSKGIPHTLGIVMYGHPGCGKTSTIKAIANETKRHIFNIALSEIKTKDALKDLFYNDTVHINMSGKTDVLNIPVKQRLYVIEDIDAMDSVVIKRSKEQDKEAAERKLRMEAEIELLKRQQGELMANQMIRGKEAAEEDKLDLATLLNVLDGVRETPGRIIILSTNYPERLDEALLRPGRFDMMLEFEKHSCAVLQMHLEKHYDCALTEKQRALVYTPSLHMKWTPAEVSQILFRRISDPDSAIQDLLQETPEQLFKFSQLKKQEEAAAKDTACTDLTELLKEEEAIQKPDEQKAEPAKEQKEEAKEEIKEEAPPHSPIESTLPPKKSVLFRPVSSLTPEEVQQMAKESQLRASIVRKQTENSYIDMNNERNGTNLKRIELTEEELALMKKEEQDLANPASELSQSKQKDHLSSYLRKKHINEENSIRDTNEKAPQLEYTKEEEEAYMEYVKRDYTLTKEQSARIFNSDWQPEYPKKVSSSSNNQDSTEDRAVFQDKVIQSYYNTMADKKDVIQYKFRGNRLKSDSAFLKGETGGPAHIEESDTLPRAGDHEFEQGLAQMMMSPMFQDDGLQAASDTVEAGSISLEDHYSGIGYKTL